MRKAPELEFQKAVKEFLDLALPKETFWTSFPAGGGGKVRGRILKDSGLVSGVPDIWILYHGKSVLLELKSPKGRLQDNQKATIERLLKAGAEAFICRTVIEVEHDLRQAGIPLKARAS